MDLCNDLSLLSEPDQGRVITISADQAPRRRCRIANARWRFGVVATSSFVIPLAGAGKWVWYMQLWPFLQMQIPGQLAAYAGRRAAPVPALYLLTGCEPVYANVYPIRNETIARFYNSGTVMVLMRWLWKRG